MASKKGSSGGLAGGLLPKRSSGGGSFGSTRSSGGGSFGADRTNGNGTGVQRMGGGDHNYLPPAKGPAPSQAKAAQGNIARGRSGGRGGGGRGGAYVDPAAARRAAVQQQFKGAFDQNDRVYGDAINAIVSRNGQIAADYDAGAADMRANAQKRAAEDESVNAARAQSQAAAAAAMGLDFTPQGGERAAVVQGANRAAMQQNAESWAGMLTSQKGTAIERNNAGADTFRYSQGQQSAKLQQLMLAALGLA